MPRVVWSAVPDPARLPTGRGVRVAIIDSGVHAAHPHVGSVAGGVAIDADGVEGDDYVDRLGHGTAVTAAIREKAPDAELYAVKVFHGSLATSISTLVHAIDWAARSGMHIANLSLGTARVEHEGVLRDAVARAKTIACPARTARPCSARRASRVRFPVCRRSAI
jgi:subtilisin family serine protease